MPENKEKWFIYGKKGHWVNKFPKKKKNPILAALFTEELDPAWWNLSWCEAREYPEGEIVFLLEEGSPNTFDSEPTLDKFSTKSSESCTSESDEDSNLGGVVFLNFVLYVFLQWM